jgi:hypothetical protein
MGIKDKQLKVSGTIRLGKDGLVWLQVSDRKGDTFAQCHRLPGKTVRWVFALHVPDSSQSKVWKLREMR